MAEIRRSRRRLAAPETPDAARSELDTDRYKELFDRVTGNVNKVIHGKEDVVRLAMVAVCANGHVLFEDVPGVGKSMLSKALSMSMRASTNRIQARSRPSRLSGSRRPPSWPGSTSTQKPACAEKNGDPAAWLSSSPCTQCSIERRLESASGLARLTTNGSAGAGK